MKKRNEIDFFAEEYRTETEQSSKTIGIVDGNSAPAFTTGSESENWNAVINNPNGKSFQFIPIDYNIEIDRGDGQKESTCDGMILCESERFLAFVELKIVRSGGDADARKQLKNTIEIFNERHDYKAFNTKNRRAYVANKEYPHFHRSDKNEEEEFRDKLHFKLFQQKEINID